MLISSPSPARDGCRKSNVNAKAPKRRNWLRILSGHLPQAQPLPRLGYTSTAASKSCLGQRCTQILQDTELLRTRLQHLALTVTIHTKTQQSLRRLYQEAARTSTRQKLCAQSTAEQGEVGHGPTSPIIKQPGLTSAHCPFQLPKRRIMGQGTALLFAQSSQRGARTAGDVYQDRAAIRASRGPSRLPLLARLGFESAARHDLLILNK